MRHWCYFKTPSLIKKKKGQKRLFKRFCNFKQNLPCFGKHVGRLVQLSPLLTHHQWVALYPSQDQVMSLSPFAAPAPCWDEHFAPLTWFCSAPPGKQPLCLWYCFRFRFYKLLPSLHRAGKVKLYFLFALDIILLLITSRDAQRFLGLEETITVI